MRLHLFFILLTLFFTADVTAAKHHRSNRQNDKYNSHRYHKLSAEPGWNISEHTAERAENCHYYSLYVSGGKGSARIVSIPRKNYIQLDSGEREGYVCFFSPTTLELGKLSNPNISVELYLEGYGTFIFDNGDRGDTSINNWHRAYWDLAD